MADHLLSKCNYTEAVWRSVSDSLGLPKYQSLCNLGGPVDWVLYISSSDSRGVVSKKKDSRGVKRQKLGYLFFFWWNVWEEMNRRIFNSELPVVGLANLLMQDIQIFSEAVSG
jgi:hypothetical protein